MKHEMKYESQSLRGKRAVGKEGTKTGRHEGRGQRAENVTEDRKPKLMKEGKSHILSEIQQLCPKNGEQTIICSTRPLLLLFYAQSFWELGNIFPLLWPLSLSCLLPWPNIQFHIKTAEDAGIIQRQDFIWCLVNKVVVWKGWRVIA